MPGGIGERARRHADRVGAVHPQPRKERPRPALLDRGDDDEGQPDRRYQRRDGRRPPPPQRAQADVLDHQADQRRHHDAEHAGQPEGLPVVDDQRVGDRGPEHEHSAVGQVQDVEHAEYQRVPNREQRVDGSEEDRVEDLLPQGESTISCGAGDLAIPRSCHQLGVIWWTRVKPPEPSILMIQTVCLTSWLEVNWNGPSGVWMLTVSIAPRSLSRSPARSENVRLARLAASARTLIAV